MWCLAHRLELAIRDALKGSPFDDVDEMLLCLYYLYEIEQRLRAIITSGLMQVPVGVHSLH